MCVKWIILLFDGLYYGVLAVVSLCVYYILVYHLNTVLP